MGGNSLLQLIVCLASVLRIQNAQAWSSPSVGETFKALLAFVTHSMPKVFNSLSYSTVKSLSFPFNF
jgi:hypothetical protein